MHLVCPARHPLAALLVAALLVAAQPLPGDAAPPPPRDQTARARPAPTLLRRIRVAVRRGVRKVLRRKPKQQTSRPAVKPNVAPTRTAPAHTGGNDPLKTATSQLKTGPAKTPASSAPVVTSTAPAGTTQKTTASGPLTQETLKNDKSTTAKPGNPGSAEPGKDTGGLDPRTARIVKSFLKDRRSLDKDASVEWVEGWHGVRAHNVAKAVPGIVADQGIWVAKSVSFMPEGAYWHPERPATPSYWTNSGAMVHFRVPKAYLETQGKWVQDRSAGNRFAHNGLEYPRSQSNKYQEVMPVQVLEVYWVKGDIPASAKGIGVDLRGKDTWP